jgi:uncharacterized protein YjbI with pentapeptide repeats
MANDEHVAMLEKGVGAWNEWRRQSVLLIRPDLFGADLVGANLTGADLVVADLVVADLVGANLVGANLTGANLRWANLSGANLTGANLRWANLTGANLRWANLTGANLIWADLTEAALQHTVFGATTLSEVKGLNHCRHVGPSIVDFQVLKDSGPLPIAFLRGVGLPDNLMPSLLNEAIQFYSCFISYSGKDELFAERLYADLQTKGVRCWFAPHDMRIGAKIIDALDEAIRLRDKVLLILSEGAIATIILWSYVEQLQGRLLSFLLNAEEGRVFVISQNVSASTVTDWIRVLLQIPAIQATGIGNLSELLAEIDDARAERNALAHGVWFPARAPEAAEVQTVRWDRTEVVKVTLVTIGDLGDFASSH